jgi:hypothetical protein
MFWLNSSLRTGLRKTFQPLVAIALDHSYSVCIHYTHCQSRTAKAGSCSLTIFIPLAISLVKGRGYPGLAVGGILSEHVCEQCQCDFYDTCLYERLGRSDDYNSELWFIPRFMDECGDLHIELGMTQPLADAVRDTGLTPCLIVRVICRHHGRMRVAVSERPERCPRCSGPALCAILGKGGTRRPMPFFQREESFYDPFSCGWVRFRARPSGGYPTKLP